MFRRLSGSVCSLMFLTSLTACPGSDAGSGNEAGSPAAGSGGSGAEDPDAGTVYQGDAGSAAGSGSNAGKGGASAGKGGSDNSWSPAKDLKPAECRPDPSNFTACGGDVTGKWRLSAICFPSGLEDLREILMCPAIEQDFSYEYRMLVEFKSSGNYTGATKRDALQYVTIPKNCLSEDSDCTELGEDDTDASDGDTLTITSSVDDCLVDAQLHKAESVAGTWRVDGADLTMTDADGPDTSEFCVSGNTLTVKSVDDLRGEVSWGVFERL